MRRHLAFAALVFCTLHASPAAAEDAAISDEAKRHFKAGVALLQDPDGEKVEEAYREFKAAYQMSQSPKILGNMGFCAMKLERDGEAIDAYSRYLREVTDIDPDERAQIVRDVQTLSVGVVRLSITVSEPTALVTDVRIPVRGERITNVYQAEGGKLSVGVRPGHHVVTVRAPGHDDATWELDALAGGRESHEFALKKTVVAPPPPPGGEGPKPAERSGPGPWPLVVAGTGVAAMAAGTVTGILALGKTSDIEKACPNDVCSRRFDLDGQKSSARTLVTVTDILLIGGGVLTVGGVAWWLLSPSGDEKKAPPAGAPAAKAASRPTFGAFCAQTGCFGSAKVGF